MADCTMAEYKVTNLAGTPTDYSDPAYWNNIRENVQTRIKAYFSEKERPSSDRPAADLKKGGGR